MATALILLLLRQASPEVKQLLKVTKESLYKGIEKAIAGNRVGDISFAIQEYTEKQFGYGVVRELVGHGLGQASARRSPGTQFWQKRYRHETQRRIGDCH